MKKENYEYKLEGNQYNVAIISNEEITQEDFIAIKKTLKEFTDSHCLKDDGVYNSINSKYGVLYNVKYKRYMLNMTSSINYFNFVYFRNNLEITPEKWDEFIDTHYNSDNHWDYAYICPIENLDNIDDVTKEDVETFKKFGVKFFTEDTDGVYRFFHSGDEALNYQMSVWKDLVNAIQDQKRKEEK